MPTILPEFPESEFKEPFYVKYFGFEIEGGFESWHKGYDSETEEPNNDYFKHDGSVECLEGIAGEIASPRFRVDRMENFRRFAIDNMPIEANSTAGMHVHISFNTQEAYARCMDIEFWNAFKTEVQNFFLEKEGKFDDDVIQRFWARFENESTYCKSEFCPEYQSNSVWNRYFDSHNGRYTQLNYPFGQHQTIECRLFPSTIEAHELIEMVEFFINFTNKYLKNIPKHERARRIKVETDTDIENEVDILCV
jgi:hypothetical protein